MRLSAKHGLIDLVRRDGERAAQLHGQTIPAADEGAGDRIVTCVPIPVDGLIVSGGTLRGEPAVQGVHRRAGGWAYVISRVVVLTTRFDPPLAASPWAPGPWTGEAVVSAAYDPGLPPEANPA